MLNKLQQNGRALYITYSSRELRSFSMINNVRLKYFPFVYVSRCTRGFGFSRKDSCRASEQLHFAFASEKRRVNTYRTSLANY